MSARGILAGLVVVALLAAGTANGQRLRNVQQGQGQRRAEGRPGDWLRKNRNLPPAEQRRALERDPAFRSLPPQRQQQLQQRLEHFNSLPPEQQNRILQRMDTFERLNPEQRQHARDVFSQFRSLPPDRQIMLRRAFRGMHDMSPAERQRLVDSPAYRSTFTDQERNLLRGMTDLNVGPAH